MSENAARIDGAARTLLTEIDQFIGLLMADKLRCSMQPTESEKALHALAVLETAERRLLRLTFAHEMLAAALNFASPDRPPILSMVTLDPATLEGAGIDRDVRPQLATSAPEPGLEGMTIQLDGRFTAEGLRSIADTLEQGHY